MVAKYKPLSDNIRGRMAVVLLVCEIHIPAGLASPDLDELCLLSRATASLLAISLLPPLLTALRATCVVALGRKIVATIHALKDQGIFPFLICRSRPVFSPYC
jgi:hypothetical protein